MPTTGPSRLEVQQFPGVAEKQVLAFAARIAEMEEALSVPSEVLGGAMAIVKFMAHRSPDDNWSVYGLGPVHHRDARIKELEAAIDKLLECEGRYRTEQNYKALEAVRKGTK